MDSFIYAISAIAPIVLMVAIGYFLKRIHLIPAEFASAGNKLVFRIFMPVMLFLKIYRIQDLSHVNLTFILYAVVALLIVFALAVPASILVAGKKDRRGVLVQASFRSGYSLIGIPLAHSLYGEEGAMAAALLSAAVIPVFNVLAVISLSALGNDSGERVSIKRIVMGIVKNPLIIGIVSVLIALGIRALFVSWGVDFRLGNLKSIMQVIEYISSLAIPLALLVLGAQFEFSAVSSLKKEIIFGTVVRCVIVPLFALGIAYFCFRSDLGKAQFAAFVSLFASPVAVPSVLMVQEMNGDVTLAGQLVVWSTLVGAFSIFLAAFFLRLGGAL
ncbi:MAG: AEC family transporter [Clostridia bacterium]|nr:AEC family transporter [Clostridia bacterium]